MSTITLEVPDEVARVLGPEGSLQRNAAFLAFLRAYRPETREAVDRAFARDREEILRVQRENGVDDAEIEALIREIEDED